MKMDSRSFSTPSLQATTSGIKSLQKTSSWRGLPAIDGCFSEPPEGNCPIFLLDNADVRDEAEEEGVEEEEEQQIVMNNLRVRDVYKLNKSASCPTANVCWNYFMYVGIIACMSV